MTLLFIVATVVIGFCWFMTSRKWRRQKSALERRVALLDDHVRDLRHYNDVAQAKNRRTKALIRTRFGFYYDAVADGYFEPRTREFLGL